MFRDQRGSGPHPNFALMRFLFETARRRLHPSDGKVESSEFKVIQEHLQAIQFAAQEAADAKRRLESAETRTAKRWSASGKTKPRAWLRRSLPCKTWSSASIRCGMKWSAA